MTDGMPARWPHGAKLPDEVFLVVTTSEWPVNVLVDDDGGSPVAKRVEDMVKRRRQSGNVINPDSVRVFRAKLSDFTEVELMPTTTVQPSLRPRDE